MGEFRLCTLVDRKRKCYDNAVDVVIRLHDPTDPSTERTAPRVQHTFSSMTSRELRSSKLHGRGPSARRRDDGDDVATDAGLRLSTATI